MIWSNPDEWHDCQHLSDLRERRLLAARQARERYSLLGANWCRWFDLGEVMPCRTLGGSNAYLSTRQIEVPWPSTTPARLFVAAKHIAHIVFNHDGRWSEYVEQYEAQHFAHLLLRHFNVKVPRRITDQETWSVYQLLKYTLVKGTRKIDPGIAEWVTASVPIGRLASRSLCSLIDSRVQSKVVNVAVNSWEGT